MYFFTSQAMSDFDYDFSFDDDDEMNSNDEDIKETQTVSLHFENWSNIVTTRNGSQELSYPLFLCYEKACKFWLYNMI